MSSQIALSIYSTFVISRDCNMRLSQAKVNREYTGEDVFDGFQNSRAFLNFYFN